MTFLYGRLSCNYGLDDFVCVRCALVTNMSDFKLSLGLRTMKIKGIFVILLDEIRNKFPSLLR